MATKQIAVSGFDEVELRGVGQIILEQSGTESLVAEGRDEALAKIEAVVAAGRLKLGFEHNWFEFWKVAEYRDTKFRVGVKNIRAVILSGSGDITSGKLAGDALRIDLNGSGNVTVAVETKRFETRLAGSGDIRASGVADLQRIEIDGSGNVTARELNGKSAEVTIRGSGNVEVAASDSLSISIMGNGNVRYTGNPKLDQRVFGSGRIERV